MEFVQNAWYAAALGSEVGEALLSRRIIGRSVVLYRTSAGRATALRDSCPHRGYPLSYGKRIGDLLECGYHGFTFDCEGTCVKVPGQDKIPQKANVHAFPVVEAGPFVWVWMGDKDAADPALLPADALGYNDVQWHFVAGLVRIACNYELLVDNLLDLSHEGWIHSTSIGAPDIAETPMEVTSHEDTFCVEAYRHMADVPAPPNYQPFADDRGHIDRTQHIHFYAPTVYMLNNRIAQPGADVAGRIARVIYLLTPQDDRTTHYFYCMGRLSDHDDVAADDAVHRRQAELIAEDAEAVERIQRRIDTEGPTEEVSVKLDVGGLAARRMIRKQLEAEGRGRPAGNVGVPSAEGSRV